MVTDREIDRFAPADGTQAADAASRTRDGGPKVIIYSELAIEADPKAYHPMLLAAGELARSTRENDLDKDEKLQRAEKYVQKAMEIIPNAPKLNTTITDAQWDEIKKEFMGEAHRDLGMVASVRFFLPSPQRGEGDRNLPQLRSA